MFLVLVRIFSGHIRLCAPFMDRRHMKEREGECVYVCVCVCKDTHRGGREVGVCVYVCVCVIHLFCTTVCKKSTAPTKLHTFLPIRFYGTLSRNQ